MSALNECLSPLQTLSPEQQQWMLQQAINQYLPAAAPHFGLIPFPRQAFGGQIHEAPLNLTSSRPATPEGQQNSTPQAEPDFTRLASPGALAIKVESAETGISRSRKKTRSRKLRESLEVADTYSTKRPRFKRDRANGRGHVWTDEQTIALLDLYRAYKHRLDNPSTTRKPIWNDLARDLSHTIGVNVEGIQAENRLRFIKLGWRKSYESPCGGRAYAFKQQLDEIFSDELPYFLDNLGDEDKRQPRLSPTPRGGQQQDILEAHKRLFLQQHSYLGAPAMRNHNVSNHLKQHDNKQFKATNPETSNSANFPHQQQHEMLLAFVKTENDEFTEAEETPQAEPGFGDSAEGDFVPPSATASCQSNENANGSGFFFADEAEIQSAAENQPISDAAGGRSRDRKHKRSAQMAEILDFLRQSEERRAEESRQQMEALMFFGETFVTAMRNLTDSINQNTAAHS